MLMALAFAAVVVVAIFVYRANTAHSGPKPKHAWKGRIFTSLSHAERYNGEAPGGFKIGFALREGGSRIEVSIEGHSFEIDPLEIERLILRNEPPHVLLVEHRITHPGFAIDQGEVPSMLVLGPPSFSALVDLFRASRPAGAPRLPFD